MANIISPIGVLEMNEVQAAARTLGLDVVASEIRRAEDIAPAIDALKGRADALYVVTEALVNTKGPVSTRRRICRQNSARGEAGRHSGRAADQVRSRY
jgi:hypothetical protein